MNAHRSNPSSAPALIEMANRFHARVCRLAIPSTPSMRLRLMGQIALGENVADEVEQYIVRAAQATLKAMPKPRALPPAKTGAL